VNYFIDMTEKENIALIELGGSHDECLYSQVLFLKKHGYRVHILIFSDHLPRIDKWNEVDNWQTFKPASGFFNEWKLAKKLRKYLLRNNIRKAIINTAEGNIIRMLTLFPGRGISYVGLIHLSRKLWSSKSQKIINRRIKKYFVLADFIADNLSEADPSLKISYFYPVNFPSDKDPAISNDEDLAGSPEKLKVCIPGAVDFARRDYSALMDEISQAGIPEDIRFVLLGRTTSPDAKKLLSRIHDEKLEKHFTWFDGFVESRVFYSQLTSSDLILPLITPGSYDYHDYLRYKITGSYNLAWGFHIPMLMHDSFSGYQIFRKTSVFYSTGQMLKTLEGLEMDALRSLRSGIAQMDDFNFKLQAENYVKFIRP